MSDPSPTPPSAPPSSVESPAGPSDRMDWKTLKKLGPTGLLGILWGTLPGVLGFVLLANIGNLSQWLLQNKPLGFVGFVAVFMVSAGLGLLPTYAQSILGGWVFGFALGFPGALMGFAGASIIAYFTAKTVSHHRVEEVIQSRPTWKAVRDALVGGTFWKTVGIVSLVRLPPNSPFALTNLVLATSGVPLPRYVLGTVIGMAPRTGLAVALAAAASTRAASIQEFLAESAKNRMLFIAGFALMVIVMAVIGYIANKAIANVTRAKPQATPPSASA